MSTGGSRHGRMLTQQDGGRTGDRMGKRAGLRQSDGDILLGREGTAGGKWHKGEGKDSRARIEKILDRVLEQAGKVNDRTREVGNRQEKLTAGESAKKGQQKQVLKLNFRKCLLNKGSGVRVKRGSHSGSEKASILNSPFGHDLSRLMQNGSLELRDLKGSVSRKKKANCKSAADVGINSARSWKEGKSYSRSRVCTETGLMKKEFNLDKFKALFGKAEERRKHSEHSRMIGELPFKACSLTVAGLKKREATVSKKSNSKESHKGSICGKNSSRGVNNPSQIHISMIPMIPFKKSIVTNPNQGSAKSREIESHRSTVTPIIQDNLVLDTHHLRKHTPEIQYKDIAHTRKTHQKSKEKGVISKLRCIQSVAKGKSRERTKESLKSQLSGGNRTDLEDVKFLFSKKLSNMQKMSLLRLQKKGREESGGNPKSRRRRLSKERHVEVEEITRNVDKMNSVELARYVKDNRLPTRMSASDSNDTCPKLCRGNGSTDGMTNTNLQDDFDEDHDQSSFELRLRDESSQKKSRRLKRMDQDVDTPKKRTRRVSKKLFERERRKSFNEERARKRAEHELHCDLQPGHISMTSDVNGRGYSNPSQAEDSDSDSEGYIGGSQLQRSNSELLLRTMVSSSSNNTRIDHNEVLHKVERERASLIDYITRYTRTFKKVPKTTLQFYKVIKLIGKGSFGKVHLGIHLLTRKKVAIKCIDKQYILEEKAQNKIIQEVTILKGLSHRNIIKILEVFENRKYVFIVTDYAAKGDLLQFMKEHNIFRESKARGIVSQILNGLEYCHARGIIHRDVKLDNVLLDKDFRVKLCDFGVSRYMPKNGSVKERCGTPAYIAPEIIKNQGYSGFLADVWSLGILLFAMVTGTIPFKSKTVPQLHKLIVESDFTFPDTVKLTDEFKDLIRQMLIKDPNKRITIDKIWKHPWMRDAQGMRRNAASSEFETIDNSLLDAVVHKLEDYGFPPALINSTLANSTMNQIAATYILLIQKHVFKE